MSEFANDLVMRIYINSGIVRYIDLDFRNDGGTIPSGIFFRLVVKPIPSNENMLRPMHETSDIYDSAAFAKALKASHRAMEILNFHSTLYNSIAIASAAFEFHTHWINIMSDIDTEMENHSPQANVFWNQLPIDEKASLRQSIIDLRNRIFPANP